ncbi:MAG: hypothetical protein RLZZ28_2405 [Bacteroidota bacterium]|jgi:quercetin dioxygenase-like cupin family protein
MAAVKVQNIRPISLAEGFLARFIHTENMTFSFLEIKAGSASAEHAHKQEQVAMLLEGIFELTIEGEPIRFEPGSVVIIPSNAKHSGLAITDCKLMDVFTPVREDFKLLSAE